MEINQTPIRTSQHYGINSVLVPDNFFDHRFEKFENLSISGDCKIEVSKAIPSAPICKEIQTELLHANSKIKLVFDKPSPSFAKLEFDIEQNIVSVLEIEAKENSVAEVLVKIEAKESIYSNFFVKCNCNDSSNLKLVVMGSMTNSAADLINFEIVAKENSIFSLTFVDFCGDYSISKTQSIVQKNAKCDLNHIYIGKKTNKIDINTIQTVVGQYAKVRTNAVGVLSQNATKNFKGTIDFVAGSKKSVGSENEYCLLLSETAKSKSMPILLSGEEDVDGSHSSATGKIGGNELFYCMSRGMDKVSATKLLVKSKFNQILAGIDPQTKAEIENIIDKEINND